MGRLRPFALLVLLSLLALTFCCTISLVRAEEETSGHEVSGYDEELEVEFNEDDDVALAGISEEDEDYDSLEGDEDMDMEGDEFSEEEEVEEGDAATTTTGKALDEEDVYVLTATNFAEVALAEGPALVEFYAPWCGHCKKLAPEFAEAATILKEEGVVLGKVDATQEEELAEKYGVQGYPTLYYILNSTKVDYTGGRTSEEIVNWVRTKMGPPALRPKDQQEAGIIIYENRITVVGYFDKFEGPEYEAFLSTAKSDVTITFVETTDPEIAQIFEIEAQEKPVIKIVRQEKEDPTALYEGDFTAAALTSWLATNKYPLITTFDDESNGEIFGGAKSMQMLIFATQDEMAAIREAVKAVSLEFRGEVAFVFIDVKEEEQEDLLEYFGANKTQLTVMGHYAEGMGKKALFKGEVTEEALKAFTKDFVAGKAETYYKTDVPPTSNNGPVKIVTGSTFNEIVMEDTKDVMLEVYAPWCGHCKALDPIYKRLGERVQGISSLVIAKMDGTTNEHESFLVESFPSIYFYPAGKKDQKPLEVEVDRSLKPLMHYLKKHASIPFESPRE